VEDVEVKVCGEDVADGCHARKRHHPSPDSIASFFSAKHRPGDLVKDAFQIMMGVIFAR